MKWTEQTLSTLSIENGYRMRGESMTRIEVFSDAAFAFAVTMLVGVLSGPCLLLEPYCDPSCYISY